MAYGSRNKINASDYNDLLGTGTESNKLNTVWGEGSSDAGYKQTAISTISGTKISASAWATLINKVSDIASHQGTAVTALTAPQSGQKIVALSALPTNLSSIYNGRKNAAAQGTTSSTNVATATTWLDKITYTFTVTFGTGENARAFFNAGGQLKFSFSHGTTTAGVNALLNSLCSAAGTVALSSPNSGSITVAGVSYNGVTKVGGSGTVTTLNSNVGYYGLTTVNQTLFKQFVDQGSGVTKYLGTFLQIEAKTNGTQLSRGDNGNILTFTITVDEVSTEATGLHTTVDTVAAGTTATLTVCPPSTTYLSNTWGTPSVAGSVTGA